MRPVVLVTCRQMQVELPTHIRRLEIAGYDVRSPQLVNQQFSSGEMIAMMKGVVGLIAGDDELDARFFDASADLKVLIRWGIGMDSVDHVAAAANGVTVRNTPGVFGKEVADSAMSYVLGLARGITLVDRTVRAGGWLKYEGVTLDGLTFGIVGAGTIGREIGTRAVAFGCDVAFYDPYAEASSLSDPLISIDELCARSSILVLACPLTEETFHLIDERRLALLPQGALIVNVARGPVVDERALIEALQASHVGGAGLDVYESEPLSSASPLIQMPNVILGAHNGSNTRQGVARASRRAIDLLLSGLGA